MRTEGQVRSVADLDIQRYLGLWYEVGRLPLSYEDEGARDVTAEYSLRDDGTIAVDNRCIDENGAPVQALGQAELDGKHPGRLRVSFLPTVLRWLPFTRADYWVLKIDRNYRYALVGTPDREHLWLLSREPRMDMVAEARFLEEARAQGFDLTNWICPLQSGYPVSDEELLEPISA